MNSKQLNFFISPEDLVEVYAFFNDNKIKYIKKVTEDINDITLENFPFKHGRSYDRIYLTCDDFKSNLSFLYDENSKKYLINSDKSYVLEFNPGGFYPASSSVLHRGRFYCTTNYFVSNREVVGKSDVFKSWVDKVFRLFKKEFLVQFGTNKSILFSEKTIKWMNDNNGKVDTPFLKITI